MPDQILSDVAKAARLREGEAGVEAVLREINRYDQVRLADVARGARLPLPVATAVRRELEKLGILERRHGLAFTEEGRKWARETLGLGTPLAIDVPSQPADYLPAPLDILADALTARLGNAPSTQVMLDQAPCTAETAARRAGLLYRSGALEGRRLLLIGDDDSISLACGLLGKLVAGRPLARRIVVADLDENRLAFLRAHAENDGLAIETLKHDFRDPLPEEYLGAFDTFITDPPYTLEGAKLFLSRGIEGIEAGRGQGLFSFGHTAPAQRLALQAAMAELGLAISALYPGFNSYSGASILGSTSELYELIVHARPSQPTRWEGPLYTADLNPRQTRYSCSSCSHKWTLGQNQIPATIAGLKDAGCPNCGNKTFNRARS